MWDSFLLDLMYLSSDMLTGRGIPVILAVTYFHLDDYLTSTMVMMGLLLAFVYNMFRRKKAPENLFLDLSMRFVQYVLAIFVSISLLGTVLSIAYPDGLLLGSLALIWILLQSLPEHPVSLCTLFLLTLVVFYTSLLVHPELASPTDSMLRQASPTNRKLQAMSRWDWYQRRQSQLSNPTVTIQTDHPISTTAPGALCIFVLSAYSGMVHGPLHNYEGKYISPNYLLNTVYAAMVLMVTSLIRAYFVITLSIMHTNVVHTLYEGIGSDVAVLWEYSLLLLLACNLYITHVTYQVLTAFKCDPHEVKLVVALLACTLGFSVPVIHSLTWFLGVFTLVQMVLIPIQFLIV